MASGAWATAPHSHLVVGWRWCCDAASWCWSWHVSWRIPVCFQRLADSFGWSSWCCPTVAVALSSDWGESCASSGLPVFASAGWPGCRAAESWPVMTELVDVEKNALCCFSERWDLPVDLQSQALSLSFQSMVPTEILSHSRSDLLGWRWQHLQFADAASTAGPCIVQNSTASADSSSASSRWS